MALVEAAFRLAARESQGPDVDQQQVVVRAAGEDLQAVPHTRGAPVLAERRAQGPSTLFHQVFQTYRERFRYLYEDVNRGDYSFAFYIIEMTVRNPYFRSQIQERNFPFNPFRANFFQNFLRFLLHST
jgi:hypothetical protein